MILLAISTSGPVASAALLQDGVLLRKAEGPRERTHSETIMGLIQQAYGDLEPYGIDALAVDVGPGSFTGVRIGVAAAKGLAWPGNKPCAPCSTLESMAWQCAHLGGEICPVMDARRSQVYNARFLAQGGGLTRLTPDRAIGLEELVEEVRQSGKKQILVGDGARLCRDAFAAAGIEAVCMPPHLIYQTAWGVARAALELARAGELVDAGRLNPRYHRLSQAERERLERLSGTNS